MEELSKKDILTLIGENLTTVRHAGYKGFDEGVDLEEMPQKPEDFPKNAPDPTKPTKRSKGVVPKWTRLYEADEEGKLVEHVGWYHFDQANEIATPIIFTCEWDEMIQRHPDLVSKLKEQFGEVKFANDVCPAYEPGRKKGNLVIQPIPGDEGSTMDIEGNPYIPSEEKVTYTREKINRTFNGILKDEIQNDQDLINGLKKLSLPQIVIDDTKHRNSYSTVNNDEISFQSHNIHLYETQKQFIKDVTTAVRTKDLDQIPTKDNKSLRRLYNTRYTNWSKTRFTQSSGYGKTPVFQLDQGDFPNDKTFEVMVSSDVKITGKSTDKNENGEVTQWQWDIEYLVEYAKKAPTDRVARKMIKDGEINKTVVVDLSEPKKFDGETELSDSGRIVGGDTGDQHPLTDINVVEGLKQVISEFKEELLSTNPTTSIRRAVTKIEDLGGERALRTRPQLNEDDIRDLVKKTIRENK
jgi:hypothetical protein